MHRLYSGGLQIFDPSMDGLQVKFLDKGNTSGYPSVIENLPALILDCNTDIRDNSAQQEHANKVNDYFKYVKDMRRHKHLVA